MCSAFQCNGTMKRREFVSAALVGLPPKTTRVVQGGFVDRSHELGHRLRDGARFSAPKRTTRVRVVIVGGGIAGLCAAWRLYKRGFEDFVVLEMEPRAGGNSRWGENEVSAFPWAAHYVPLPGKEMTLARELMEDIGVLRNGLWDERYLCHSPQERLYLHGRWQEGLEPEVGVSRRDRDEFRRFYERMDQMAASGEFRIPVETGRIQREDLDRVTMAEWLRSNGFLSPYLHWLADYSCRDDYGSSVGATSAWAGIHYFASRREQGEKGPLTWPEGNGWIVRRLLDRVGERLRTGIFVHQVEQDAQGVRARAGEEEFRAEWLIFAAPTYLGSYLMKDTPRFEGQYSPWLTANLTLERWPEEKGVPSCWDNIIYKSPALGYVVATHQSLRTHVPKTVWTYYWALAEHEPAAGRRLLLERDWNWWTEAILRDLEKAHPDIRQCVSRVDLMRFGHAMVRPSPGFLFREQRRQWLKPARRVVFANSDLSGISIFEEAQWRGVRAAEQVLRWIG